MAPKIKISKEDIINASVELVRSGGEDALNTRAIASYLGCSTQPIFSNFTSMEDLKLAVVKAADELYGEYTQKEIENGWKCSCGSVNKGKFCPECGAKRPANAPVYQCDKCGFKPEDPRNPPKFCPECGDPFNDADAT